MDLEALLNNQAVIVILLLLFVGAIGLIAYLLQNKLPFLKQPEEPVDKETAVREEVERVIVKLDRPTFENTETPKEKKDKTKVTKAKKKTPSKKNVKSKS